jgi:hypothetical protein
MRLKFDFNAGFEKIQPFSADLFTSNGPGGLSVNVELAAIEFGPAGELVSGDIVGFEINDNKTIRRFDKQINNTLNYYIVLCRASCVVRFGFGPFVPGLQADLSGALSTQA